MPNFEFDAFRRGDGTSATAGFANDVRPCAFDGCGRGWAVKIPTRRMIRTPPNRRANRVDLH
ncbi:MAG: hypothetical protein NZ534_02955 [Bacteroidia bacterium]|nr:hypothetical protein [Bacteroidia bacterium]